MSEPEDVLIDAAEVATETAVGMWRRHAADVEEAVVELEDVRRRLDLFLKAALGLDVRIVVAEPPRPPSWLERWLRGTPDFLVRRRPIPSTDGVRVRLPRELPAEGKATGREVARFRIYAVEQAWRVRRGTARCVPSREHPSSRRLFELAEAAAIDRTIADAFPGLVDDLREERRRALAARPDLEAMSTPERRVESVLRDLARAAPADPPDAVPRAETPEASREWAEEQVGRIADREAYRGVPAVDLWGRIEREAAAPDADSAGGGSDDAEGEQRRTETVDRRPRVREADEGQDERSDGWFVTQDDLHETAQDPMGLNRPVDRDDEVDPDELAESLAEMQQGRLVRTDDPAREVLASEDPPPRSSASIEESDVEGLCYPEWDYRSAEYLPDRVTVRSAPVEPADGRWAERMVRERGRLIREVRRCFEQLRPRRERLRRQPDGPEVDVGAYVEAYGDRRAGSAPEDRLYRRIRPGRREVAVELLVDVSASTDSW
ncbi:MAG: hypothetical protein ABEL76_04320, partial [Bradymonadaceae bacterium]